MSEADLRSMHLGTYLGADIEACRAQIAAESAQLAENEKARDALQAGLGAKREEKASDIGRVGEQVASLAEAIAYNERFASQCTALSDELQASNRDSSASVTDRRTVEARVTSELEESRTRLAAQSETCKSLSQVLLTQNATMAAKIAKLSLELMRCSSDVSAKDRSVVLSKAVVSDLQAELRLLRAKTSDPSAIEVKDKRASATAEAIDDLREKMGDDSRELAARVQAEQDIVDNGKLQLSTDAATSRYLSQEITAVRLLIGLQDSVTAEELKADSNGARTVTGKQLATDTRGLMDSLNDGGHLALAHLTSRSEEHEAAVAASTHSRETQLKLLRTERQAIEVSNEQRSRFLVEKERQLEVEKAEVSRARAELLDRQHTITTLELDLDEAEATLAAREKRVEATKKAMADKDSDLRKLKMQSKLIEGALRVRIASEREVEASQRRYVSSMTERLKMESTLAAHMEKVVATTAELSASSNDVTEAMEAPLGARGLALVSANIKTHAAWLGELKGRSEALSSELADHKDVLQDSETRAAEELASLAEAHGAIAHTLTKLRDYEAGLDASMASTRGASLAAKSLPSAEVLGTPYKAAYKYMPADGSVLAMRSENPPPGTPAVEPVTPPSVRVQAPPSPAVELERGASSPYEVGYNFLAASGVGPKAGDAQNLDALSDEIISENNHPLYNPDLTTSSQGSSSWFARRTSSSSKRATPA